ncbi:hypothetical protein KPL71_008186 [Citrus sinensis]|uniref:Uncharacterized protein n=1 Tax=Citrus sinensis TaxID=2711 RepID=A0ACB8M532_CITSI|nr:hypothetical protein KPL71_008186 [Citrus sinensis]
MLDTRFIDYQDAIIGIVLTTLHAGSVLLTFYPNFNLSLQDTNLSTALQVQVQIQGADQVASVKIATLHHQLVYRLQNHALDLPSPEHHSDALMTTESMFERRYDGTVRMIFRPPPTAPEEPPWLSFTYSAMVTAVQTTQEKLPITGFTSKGYPVYPAKLNGHFFWDSPGSGNCDPDCPCWDNWEEDDPSTLPMQPMAYMMFSSTSQDYSSNFPALETHTDLQRKVITKPFIPSAITPTCHLEDPKPFEAVLNWQTQNARAQNEGLVDIHKKIIPDPYDTDQTSDSNLAVSVNQSESDTNSSLESSISSSDSEKSYADITRILMAQPEESEPAQSSRTGPFFEIPSDIEEDPPEASSAPNRSAQSHHDHKPSNGPWFTFDDIPAAKWRDKLSEMAAWTDLQMLRANATIASVLRELATRFTGSLRDWFDTLREYRQLQFVQLPNVSSALSIIHEQFIGESVAVFEAARRDYLNMKCCSLNSKDLDFYYKWMSILFYKLNGFNDPTLKHVFLASLPEELQPDIQRQLTSLNLTIDTISLGKIFQIAKGCLEKATTDYSPHNDEIESYFSEQEEPTDETVFALQNSSDDSENDEFQTVFHQQLLSLDTTIPIPSIKLHILPSKFQRPIPAIGLLDTRAQRSFDIIHQIKHLQIIPTGIRVKSMFKPFTNVLKLYGLSETSQPFQDISTRFLKFCPESHADFHHPNPLWKNPQFFVQLPFKLNEDVNPTKATHLGMSPSDLVLAQKECSQLLVQGTPDDHRHLLNQFFDIIQFHGIMLSTKKSTIATHTIEFLGMTIKDGHYQPGKHIAQELIHFPDQHLSKRQLQ